MSLPDTIFIFVLALIIFGPKKLPEIGRQIGKLVGEFRRASNEFKFQIEEELRNVDIIEKPNNRPTMAATPDNAATETSSEAVPESASDSLPDLTVGQHPNIDSLNNIDGLNTVELNPSGLESAPTEPATVPNIIPAEGVEARTTIPYAAVPIAQPPAIENASPLPEAHHSDNVHSGNGHSVPAEAEITHG